MSMARRASFPQYLFAPEPIGPLFGGATQGRANGSQGSRPVLQGPRPVDPTGEDAKSKPEPDRAS